MDDAKKIPGCVIFASDLPGARAVTDRGREIPLFHYKVAVVVDSAQSFELESASRRREYFRRSEAQFLVLRGVDASTLCRIAEPSLAANCHGWTFASGRYGIKDEHVEKILIDQGYASVTEPREGDLAIYWDGRSATHSGVVHVLADGVFRIRSKWGPFSVFEHAPEAFYYPGGICAIYRNARQHHGLTIPAGFTKSLLPQPR